MDRTLLLVILLGLALVPSAFPSETIGDDSADTAAGETAGQAGGNAETNSEIMSLKLEDCVRLAIEQNRGFLREEENFVLENLAYELTQHNYGPLVSSSVSTGTDDRGSVATSANASVRQRLTTGGDVGLSATSSGTDGGSGLADSYSTVISLDYVQPLLRDGGTLVGSEELTQAGRDLQYAKRSLALYRQSFLINIVRQYYRIVQQAKTIRNQERKVESADILFERSKAQRDRGKASPIDVYRAELTLLQARNQLIDAKDFYQLSLDEFKIDLGLPTDEEVAIEEKELGYDAMDIDAELSVKLALLNRLELKTAKDQVDDSKRKLDIARNQLKGRLDFSLSLQEASSPAEKFKDQDFGDTSWSMGIEYEIPLDRKAERTDYRRSLIAYLRDVRSMEELRDEIIVEVRSVIRDLRQSEATLKIQERNIEVAKQQLERAREDYDRGTITNRDVVDALNDLTDAENRYEESLVDYYISKLELMRATGVLEFENWEELLK